MNKHQSHTWNLLVILIIVVLFLGVWSDFGTVLLSRITTPYPLNLSFNPLDRNGTRPRTSGTTPTSAPASNNNPTRTFDIPLFGGGEMHVNARDLQSAIDNVIAQGGRPAQAQA